jgi:hypothetical protein
MGFSARQVKALRRNLDHRCVCTRESNGRTLSYIEGWYAISEANRIFGFDGWNRKRSSPVAYLRAKIEDLFLRSTRPVSGYRSTRTAQQLSGKVMERVKVAAPRPVRFTTRPSSQLKPTPPSVHSPRSANRSD